MSIRGKITFVAVVFNNFEFINDFCKSIECQLGGGDIHCVVVDNSSDASYSAEVSSLQRLYSFVSILKPLTNLGYFGAFNFFFENYKCGQDEIVVLCNNDLIFDKEFVCNLIEAKYNSDVCVVCPDVITFDGFHQNPHVLKPRNLIQRLKLDLYFLNFGLAKILLLVKFLFELIFGSIKDKSPTKACYLHMGIGACYILLPSFLSRFKKLEYPHFLYGEEAYLSRQVHSGGGRLFYDPNLKVLHKEGGTLSKLPNRVTYNYGKQGYWFYRKFY